MENRTFDVGRGLRFRTRVSKQRGSTIVCLEGHKTAMKQWKYLLQITDKAAAKVGRKPMAIIKEIIADKAGQDKSSSVERY